MPFFAEDQRLNIEQNTTCYMMEHTLSKILAHMNKSYAVHPTQKKNEKKKKIHKTMMSTPRPKKQQQKEKKNIKDALEVWVWAANGDVVLQRRD